MSIDNKNIISFPGKQIEDTFDDYDLSSMTPDQLSELYEKLSDRFDALQDEEPDDPESPECLKWLGKISDIEDMMDEVSEWIEN